MLFGMRRIIVRMAVACLLLGLAAAVVVAVFASRRWAGVNEAAAQFDLSRMEEMPAISEVFDARGNRMGRLAGDVRYTIGFDQLPQGLIDAVIAREDQRFWKHAGVDYRGILRAAWRNLRAGAIEEGASTVTQQLARNTFSLPKDKWERKLVEAALALRLERHFSKREILGAYFNRIYFGDGVHGVETAARIYFGKSAAEVGLSEAAILAGMIRSPNRLSPLDDPKATLAQRDQVLGAMRELGTAAPGEVRKARAEGVPLTKRRLPEVRQDYAMDGIRRELEILLSPEQRRKGGLKIYTTIDPRLQAIATDVVEAELHKVESIEAFPHPARMEVEKEPRDKDAVHSPYVQGALVAVENATGAIRAIVGGRDFADSPYNRALLSRRQIGSTFKPFVYAAAFERGLPPSTPVSDAELQPGEIRGAPENWSPQNSDHENAGIRPASWGLIKSRNTMTLRVGNWAGLENVRRLGEACGVASAIPTLPAIYLGAFESTLADLTAAYTVFANRGLRRQNYLIERIADAEGRDLYRAAHVERRCLRPQTAWAVQEALVAVTRSGTAARMAAEGFDQPAAGKTGTTDDYKDAWFVGYISDLTCGVWVGLDQPQTIMKRGYGSALALPIWTAFMKKAVERTFAAKPFEYQGPVEQAIICSASGKLADGACQAAGTARTVKVPAGTSPRNFCPDHYVAVALNDPLGAPARALAPVPAELDGMEVRRAEPVSAMPVRRAVPVRADRPAGADVRVEAREGGMTIYRGEPQ